jgi:hypothetical protein
MRRRFMFPRRRDRGHAGQSAGGLLAASIRAAMKTFAVSPRTNWARSHGEQGQQQDRPHAEPPGEARPDSVYPADGQQRAVCAGLLVQDLNHVQDEHGEPGGVHGADDTDSAVRSLTSEWRGSHARPVARSWRTAARTRADSYWTR